MVLETLTLYVPEPYLNPGPRGFIPFYQTRIWGALDNQTITKMISVDEPMRLEHTIGDSQGRKTSTHYGVKSIKDLCENPARQVLEGLEPHPLGPQVKAHVRVVANPSEIEKKFEELSESRFWTHAVQPITPQSSFCMTPYGRFSLEGWLRFSEDKKPKRKLNK